MSVAPVAKYDDIVRKGEASAECCFFLCLVMPKKGSSGLCGKILKGGSNPQNVNNHLKGHGFKIVKLDEQSAASSSSSATPEEASADKRLSTKESQMGLSRAVATSDTPFSVLASDKTYRARGTSAPHPSPARQVLHAQLRRPASHEEDALRQHRQGLPAREEVRQKRLLRALLWMTAKTYECSFWFVHTPYFQHSTQQPRGRAEQRRQHLPRRQPFPLHHGFHAAWSHRRGLRRDLHHLHRRRVQSGRSQPRGDAVLSP